MGDAEIVVVGHCTVASAKIFYCIQGGGDRQIHARVQWRFGQRGGVKDVQLEWKNPCHLGVFELKDLPPGAQLEYAITTAEGPGMLSPAGSFPSQGIRRLRLPPTDRPPRVALVSCNGAFNYAPEDPRRNALWRALGQEIRQGKVDLVIHCGDQIYADPIWEWHDSDPRNRGLSPQSNTRIENLKSEYRRWYFMTWIDPDVAEVLSSVPNIMTWDDHDIYDGYGSHDDDDQPTERAFFEAARAVFLEFQASHGTKPLEASSSLTGFVHGELGILLLDTRTNRMWNASTVLGEAQLTALAHWLANAPPLKHLYVVSSIPIVHARVAGSVKLLDLVPGEVPIEDDLRDAWTAPNNTHECHRLMKRLFVYQDRHPETQVTVLSGDVHVGAVGELRASLPSMSSHPGRIYQVTASGIGSPPPTGIALWLVKLATSGNWIELGSPDFQGRLIRMSGVGGVVIDRRNFAVLDPADSAGNGWERNGNLLVTFYSEGTIGQIPIRLTQVLNGPGRRPIPHGVPTANPRPDGPTSPEGG
ncbi:MAG: alkaline phosphatase family protein [Acidobacteria bacterium]|nr:alkaline phosphatase family protein [Acidobacteriota bacterium]